jgi:shikimate dehydrogenase
MKRYGLIGYPLTHSFSKRYFAEKFEREGITGCSYVNYSLPSIGELAGVLRDPELCGLNVTIPYKQQVIPFLDVRDEVVGAIGACNCIKIVEGRLSGFNTDVVGFGQSLVRRLEGHHHRALVLGSGGAAKAVEWVLGRHGISWLTVSRKSRSGGTGSIGYEDVDAGLLAEHTLVINTTPLGMYPHIDECPPLPYEAMTSRHYLFDLIYNPAKTLFLQKGEARGATVENGLEMLVLQAEESWRIWNE